MSCESHNAATIALSPELRSSGGDIFVSNAFLTSIILMMAVYHNTMFLSGNTSKPQKCYVWKNTSNQTSHLLGMKMSSMMSLILSGHSI